MKRLKFLPALLTLVPAWLEAQGLPARYQDKKRVSPPPAGYELPLELVECYPTGEPVSLGLACSLRAKQLSKKFFIQEVFFAEARVNGKPVDLGPYPASFSTQFTGPVALEQLRVPLSPADVREALAQKSGGVRFEADAYVAISPSLLEMFRFRATSVLLEFPLDVRVPLTTPDADVPNLDLARYYSPVIFQQTNDHHRDLITRFDFDGNWRGSDNAENVSRFPLPAHVYYSVVQSRDHYFIGYYFYHPADYVKLTGPACGFFNRLDAHENDLEGVQLVVAKGPSRYGTLLFMETLAHDVFYQLEASDRVRDKREVPGVLEDIDGHVELDGDGTGQHPVLYVECLGHGVWGYGLNGKEVKPEDSYVLYRSGEKAEVPESSNDRDVRYELIDVFHPQEGLWAHRAEFGPEGAYAEPGSFWDGLDYRQRLGSVFHTDEKVAHARPPWGWKAKGSRRGDWFLAPAYALSRHLSVTGLEGEASTYAANPYLPSGGRNPTAPVEEEAPPPTAGGGEAAPPPGSSVAEMTELVLEKGDILNHLNELGSWDGLLKAGEALLLPLASKLLSANALDMSRLTLKYRSFAGLKGARFYWRTKAMEAFDEKHSVRLRLSPQPGWHYQTVELLELPAFDRLDTIVQFKLELDLDRDALGWSFTPQELLETLRTLPQTMRLLFERSDYVRPGGAPPERRPEPDAP